MAHTTASSSAGWSTPEPGRVEMLHAMGIPSSCCIMLATSGTMLSPAARSPHRTPPQGDPHNKPQPGQELARQVGCLAGPLWQQR